MIMVKVDYRGYELVKCANCGEEYPIYEHECPECGSSETIWLREEVDDEKS